jgi:hypothetical protein
MNARIMYLEGKIDGLTGPGRIGRVTFSKTGRTLRYGAQELQPISGYKANYVDLATGQQYWISGCKKGGDDTLYPAVIEIDEDVREEYWLEIRNRPDCVHRSSFRSEGKYSKRRPR